jgi:hypothetical protein
MKAYQFLPSHCVLLCTIYSYTEKSGLLVVIIYSGDGLNLGQDIE